MPEHAIWAHGMTALDIAHQFNHLLDLPLGIFSIGRIRIPAVA
jgi:hypothetical protein